MSIRAKPSAGDIDAVARDGLDGRSQQARRLADEWLAKLASGMAMAEGELIARHPELIPELEEELQRARLIAHARDHANAGDGPRAASIDGLRDLADSEAHSVRLQCPHCRSTMPISTADSWTEIVCPSCGSGFKLVDDDESANNFQPGTVIGRFELLERIGTGGFGVVWKARDPQLDRVVALKIPRRGELTGAEAESFFREARAAAQVRHPGIVSIHEVGRDGGVIYLVSDFVDGEPLTALLEDGRPSVRDSAMLCRQIALALAHIHERGIVHRDLKPANVIVTRGPQQGGQSPFAPKTPQKGTVPDGSGLQPHLTDFGLARRMTGEVTMTIDGQIMGTPAYMSPEQASGGGHAAGPATDIYSLGVILFELLTGEPPFRGTPTMIMDQLLHEEPVSPRRLNAHVPRDLETITIKCLEKAPARRYATAAALAGDLDRWLRGEPIVARPLGHISRAYRWCRRHPVASVVALLLIVGGPTVGLVTGALAWRASIAEQRTSQVLYASTMRNVQTAVEQGDYLRAEQLLLGLRPAPGQPDLRTFPWYYWWRQSHAGLVATVRLPPNEVADRAMLEELRRVAENVLPEDRGAQISSKATLIALNEPRDRPYVTQNFLANADVHGGQVSDGVLSADEHTFASCGRDGTVQLWDAHTRAHRKTLRAEPQSPFVRVDISPPGSLVAAASTRYLAEKDTWDSEIYVWDTESGKLKLRSEVPGLDCKDLAFLPDANALLVCGGAAPLVIDLESGKQRTLAAPGRQVTDCDVSPDGQQLVGISNVNHDLWLWNGNTGNISRTLSPHPYLSAVRFYPTAQEVVSVSHESLKLWNLSDDSAAPSLTEPVGLRRLAFTADAQRLVSGTSYRRISIWDVSGGGRIHNLGPELRCMSLSPDSNVIAAYRGNDVILYSAASGERIHTLKGHHRDVRECHIADSGAFVVSADGQPDDQDGQAEAILWNAKSGRLLHRLPGHFGHAVLAISPDERTLVTLDRAWVLRVWEVATGRLMLTTEKLQSVLGPSGATRLAFSPDGQTMYACSSSSVIAIDPLAGALRHKMALGTISVSDLCVSPDGKTLAVARGKWTELEHDEGVVELWDLASGELKTSLGEEHGSAICVAFSPDGRTLASGHRSGKIALWQAATDEEVTRQAAN